MFTRDALFRVPLDKIDDWTFDEKVSIVFSDMIQRSIPGYSNILSVIGIFAKHFVTPNSSVYDLGCALGAVSLSIHRNIKISNCQIIAVDKSPTMVQYCRDRIMKLCLMPPIIKIVETDICDLHIENASLVVLNFTLQFLHTDLRLSLLKKIFRGLNYQGALIISEKFSFKDHKIDTLLYNMHYDFKRTNGYSELEIVQKRNMLKNVMITDDLNTHKLRLKRAGFSHVELWFQYFNFGSIIALKC